MLASLRRILLLLGAHIVFVDGDIWNRVVILLNDHVAELSFELRRAQCSLNRMQAVENHIRVSRAGNASQIMDTRLAIEAHRQSVDLITHINDKWVVRNDRIVVQRDDEAVIVFKCLLDVIQRVVTLHGIGLGGHDLRADVGNELGIGSLSEKRVDRPCRE